jgi:hypothetical protein
MAAKQGTFHRIVIRTIVKFFGAVEKMVQVQQLIVGEPFTLSHAPHVWQLVLDKRWYGGLSCTYCSIISCTYLSSMVYRGRENSTGLPDMVISGVKHVWVQKSTLRILLTLKPYSCSTITTGLSTYSWNM